MLSFPPVLFLWHVIVFWSIRKHFLAQGVCRCVGWCCEVPLSSCCVCASTVRTCMQWLSGSCSALSLCPAAWSIWEYENKTTQQPVGSHLNIISIQKCSCCGSQMLSLLECLQRKAGELNSAYFKNRRTPRHWLFVSDAFPFVVTQDTMLEFKEFWK